MFLLNKRDYNAYVHRPNGQTVKVKNLGWLRRHWQNVERLEWIDTKDHFNDGVFRAYMRDGSIYATPYASFKVWINFIDRPIFRGLPVTVNGISGTV